MKFSVTATNRKYFKAHSKDPNIIAEVLRGGPLEFITFEDLAAWCNRHGEEIIVAFFTEPGADGVAGTIEIYNDHRE